MARGSSTKLVGSNPFVARRGIKLWLLDLFFPRQCLHCGCEGTWLCPEGQAKLVPLTEYRCYRCHEVQATTATCANCQSLTALDGVWVMSSYHGAVVEPLIRLIKYHYITDLVGYIGILVTRYLERVPEWSSNAVLVPVPLHWRRYAERGFNQSELLAHVIHEVTNNPVDSKLLQRVTYHQPQAKLSAAGRRQNVCGGFQVEGLRVPEQVVLIDDVCTTGTTLEVCAQALKAAGIKEVRALVIARG